MSDDKQTGQTGYKILALVASLIGAFVARKALTLGWRLASGKEPPSNPEHPEVTWAEAASWAIVSGAVVGLARMIAQKRVAASWHKSTGTLPPGLEETAA